MTNRRNLPPAAAGIARMRVIAWPLALAMLIAAAAFTLARAAEPPPPAITQGAADAVARMGKAVAAKQFMFTARTIRVYLDET